MYNNQPNLNNLVFPETRTVLYIQSLQIICRFLSTVEITAASCIGEVYGKEEVIRITIDQLVSITVQNSEIISRVVNGCQAIFFPDANSRLLRPAA